MKVLISRIREFYQSSYWAIPLSGIVVALVLLASCMFIDAGTTLGVWLNSVEVLEVDSFESARSLFGVIGSITLGILSTVFSITITTLVLASQQFGPRLLRTYMQKQFIQAVLASYAGVGVYAMLGLFLMTTFEALGVLPVITTVVLMVAFGINLLLLVFFVHYTVRALQINNIIYDVYHDFTCRADAWFPADYKAPTTKFSVLSDHRAYADKSGYVHNIVLAKIAEAAEGNRVQMLVRPGDFLVKGQPILMATQPFDDETADKFKRCIIYGNRRDPQHDVRYNINQLVEIALRALSPGINDPMSAMACIDWLAAIAKICLTRPELAAEVQTGDAVVVRQLPISHKDIVDQCFRRIEKDGAARGDLALHLIKVLINLHDTLDNNEHVRQRIEKLILQFGRENHLPEEEREFMILVEPFTSKKTKNDLGNRRNEPSLVGTT